jgi:hypothetical protein
MLKFHEENPHASLISLSMAGLASCSTLLGSYDPTQAQAIENATVQTLAPYLSSRAEIVPDTSLIRTLTPFLMDRTL